MVTKRTLLIFVLIVATIGIMIAIAWFVPMPLNPYLDFQVLYRADRGILQGIALYDRAGQEHMVARELGVAVDRVFVLPFPYPPWFALATLPLALLPIEVAVRLWFLLNIVMFLTSVWLITDGWNPRSRLISFVLAPLFYPILGALVVGQYVFPTILGMAMLIRALQTKSLSLIALGLTLVTFKPHIGMFVVLAVLARLVIQESEFSWRAIKVVVATGLFLFGIGFLADGNWFLNYWRSLIAFNDVSECKLCVSLPVTIAQFADSGFDQSIYISAALLLGLTFVLARFFPKLNNSSWIASVIGMALLVNPYLQNYDFAFVIIPLFVLAGTARSAFEWLTVVIAFLMPWAGFGFLGRDGSVTLLVSTILILIVILTQVRNTHTIAA